MSKRQISHEDNESTRARKAGKDMNNVNANPGPSSGDKPENEKIWKKVRDVQNQILMLTNRVGKIEPTMGKVVEAVNVVKETLQSSLDEDNLASIMKDVIQQVRLEEVENDNVRRKGQVKEVTEVRSNSGHFDGVIKSKLKRYKNLSGGKQWKEGNLGGSECSVSPPLIDKIKNGMKVGSIPKQARRVPGPRFNRALFRDDEDEGTLIKDLKKVPANKGLRRAGPYTSKSQISQHDARIAEYIFYQRDRTEHDHDEKVCSCDGSFMNRTDMRCLRPGGLVCSNVSACQGMAQHKTYQQWIQHTANVSRMSKFYGRLGKCDRIFVPMHEPKHKGRTGHWYLLVIHVKDRYVELIDSLEDEAKFLSRRRDAKSTLDMLDVVLVDDIRKLLEPLCNLSSLPWAYKATIRQPNKTDCGIFVIRNMEDPTSKWAQQYDSETERLRLLLECVRHEKNEVTDVQVTVEQSLLSWKAGKGNTKVSKKKAAPVIVNLTSGET
ncbi:hypothetical protein ACLB2K_009317 [Fragaria x ananassa]